MEEGMRMSEWLSKRSTFVAFSLIVLVAGAGCDTIGSVEDGGRLPSGLVYGRITTSSGAPLLGVSVQANVHSDSTECRAGVNGLSGGAAVVTDSLGRFRKVVTSPLAPASYCVSVRVLALPSGGAPSGVTVGSKKLNLNVVQNGLSIDSVQVDVRLP
jgi:hypothetical protein